MDYSKVVEAAIAQGAEYNQAMNAARENAFILPADQQGAPPPSTSAPQPIPNIHDKMPSIPQAAYSEQREQDSNPNANIDPNHQPTMDPMPSTSAMEPTPNMDSSMSSNPNISMESDPNLSTSLEGAGDVKHLAETSMGEGGGMIPPYEEGGDENSAPPNLFDTKCTNPILVRGSWQWICNQCPKSYTSKSNLIAHLLDHCGIKPHMCLACGKSFKQVAHLNTHRVIHTGRRKHICPICGRGFNQRVHLKRHMVTHNINVACTCELCGRKFAFPSELQFHHKKVHRKRSGPPKKNTRSPASDMDNLQHFNASATMHPMIASQSQAQKIDPNSVKRHDRYAHIPRGTQYMPTGRRRTKAMKAQAAQQLQAAYASMQDARQGRGPLSPGHVPGVTDHLPHASNHLPQRNDRTPPRHPQMSPRNDKMSPSNDPNAQGDDQMYPRNDRTPSKGGHLPQRQDSSSSRSSAMSPGQDHLRQSFPHGGAQSPRGSDHGPHDDGLLPAELFQPELVHPDAGKAVLQPDAMETLRFQPTRSTPSTQRYRTRAGVMPNPRKHSAKKKGAPLKPELTCSECGRQFAFPFELRDHLARHRDVRPHVCTECGHQFFKEHHLKQHALIHTGLKPFRCHICDRAFALKANMLRHTKLHVNNRQYKCQVCDKSFSQKQTLSNHMVVHKDEKPFACNICGKKFSRKVNLDSHVYLHFGNKPFKCSICGSKYNNKGNLKRHVKQKHGLDADLQSDGEKEENGSGENADESQQMGDDVGRVGLDTSGEVADDEADVTRELSEDEAGSAEQTNATVPPSFNDVPQPLAAVGLAAPAQQATYEDPHPSNQKEYVKETPPKTQQTFEQPPQATPNQQHYNDHQRPVSQSSYEEPERPLSQRHYSEPEEAPTPQQEYVTREPPRRQSYGEQEQARTPESYANSEYIRQQSYPSHDRIALPDAYRNAEHSHAQPPFPDHEQAIAARNYVNREPPRQPLVYADHHRPGNLDSYVPREAAGGRDAYTPYHAAQAAVYPRHGYHHVERFKIEQGEAMAPQNPMLMHPNMGLPM